MEKDTVLLGVDRYNELRDFKKNIEDGKVYSVRSWHNSWDSGSAEVFFTNDEVIGRYEEENKRLNNVIESLNETIAKKDRPKEITIEDVKKMSLFEFRKWKNK